MIKLLSTLIVILFCWVIFPYKWIKHAIFINRKSKAIKEADKRQKTTAKKVMVIQIADQFIVGVNDELKRMDKKAFKILKLNRNEQFVWNYKNSLIYSAK
jgi:flagellar biogenesis protein FliO